MLEKLCQTLEFFSQDLNTVRPGNSHEFESENSLEWKYDSREVFRYWILIGSINRNNEYINLKVEDLENRFVQPMLEYYKSSAVSAVSKEWNNERSMIIRGAVQRLVPQIQQETGLKLLNEAKNVVTEAYSTELWRYVSTPPVQVQMDSPIVFTFSHPYPDGSMRILKAKQIDFSRI